MSFGAIAEDYNRLRSGPPDGAVRWLVPAGCRVAVDVGAGTGLLSRALAAHAEEVIAVEPDSRMRAVLQAWSPGVRVVNGKGEAIPLPDASADGVFFSSAWHWMDPDLAVPEIARVLRDGGRFGVIWTSRDREVDWIRDIDRLREPGRLRDQIEYPDQQPSGPAEHQVPLADRWPPPARARRREVVLPEPSPFADAQTASFSFTRSMSRSDVVDMIGTYSGIITASEGDKNATLAVVRDVLDQRFPGQDFIDLPMRSLCWRASRLSR
jgi:SAM-dependent methyltransferase